MNGIKRRLIAGLSALAIAAASGVPAVFAEGSKELTKAPSSVNIRTERDSNDNPVYDGTAYRPYAEWRNRPQLGDAVPDGSGNVKKDANGNEVFENMVQSKSVFYAYAKKGEKVYFGQSGHTATDRSIAAVATDKEPTAAELAKVANGGFSGSTIAVTMPVNEKTAYDPSKEGAGVNYAQGSEISGATYGDKRVFLFKPENKKGIITNAVQEQTGPKYGDDAERNLYGYEPFVFEAPEDGTYAFRFLSLDFVGEEKFDPFATAAPTAAPTEVPAATEKPSPTRDPETVKLLPKNTVVIMKTTTGSVDVNGTLDEAGYTLVTQNKNDTEKISISNSTGTAFGQTYSTCAAFKGATSVIAVRPAITGKLYIAAIGRTDSQKIEVTTEGGTKQTGSPVKDQSTVLSFDVSAGEVIYIHSNSSGWYLEGLYLSTDGTYPTPTPEPVVTEAPTAEPTEAPTPTPTPAELPYGTYMFTSDDSQDTGNNTADRANGETIRLIKNDLILENGTSSKSLWVAHTYTASVFDTTSDYAVYIGNSGGSTSAGGIRVIPQQSGTLTAAFCGTDANKTLTIEQNGTATASGAGSSAVLAADAIAGTVSAEVTAGVPVDIYSTTGSVYIYGLKLEAAAVPTQEPAYAEWVLSDNSSSVVKSGVANNPTLSLGTLSDNKGGTISYDTFHSGTKSYSSGTKFYYFKLGNGTQVTVTPDLANTSYEGYNLKIVYSNVKNANAVSVKATYTNSGEGATTVTGEDTSTTTYDVKTLNLTGLNADTVTIERNIVNEPELLYVGIEYYGGTASAGTSSVSGTAQTASLSAADSVSYVNESIKGVTVSGLAQVVMGGTTFSALPRAAALTGTASLMDAVNTKTLYSQDFESMTTETMIGVNNSTNSNNTTTNTIETDSTNYLKVYGPSDRNRQSYFVFTPITTDSLTNNKATISFRTKLASGNFAGTSDSLRSGNSTLYVLPNFSANAPSNGDAPTEYLFAVKVESTNDGSNRNNIAAWGASILSKSDAIVLNNNGSSSYGVTVIKSSVATTNWITISADIDFTAMTADISVNGITAGTVELNTTTTGIKGFSLLAGQKAYGTVNLDDIVITTEATYTITTDNNITGGSVAVSGGLTEAAEGTTITVTPTAETNYTVSSVTYTDANGATQTATANGDGTYSFTMPAANVTISAAFTQSITPSTLTVNYVSNGEMVEGAGKMVNLDSESNYALNSTYNFYAPAYVSDSNGNWYVVTKSATDYLYAAQLIGVNTTLNIDCTPAADVIDFMEIEDASRVAKVKTGSTDVVVTGNQIYSRGGAYATSQKPGGFYTEFVVTETGSYRFSGIINNSGNARSGSMYIYSGISNVNRGWTQPSGVRNLGRYSSSNGSFAAPVTLEAGTYHFYLIPDGGLFSPNADYILVEKISASYDISVDSNITDGAVAVNHKAAEGEKVTITAAPALGYELGTITYTPEGGDPVTVDGTSFTMPAANVTVSATFTEVQETSITLNSSEGGTAAITSGTTTSTLTGLPVAAESDTVSGTYTPDQDFRLASLTVRTISGEDVPVTAENGTFSFVMPASKVIITVTFADTKLALVPMSSTRKSNGAINVETIASANGYGESTVLYSPEIVDKEGSHIGAYSSGLIAAANEALTISGPAALNGIDGDSLDGVVEVIPANYGILVLNYTAADGAEVRMAQTPEFSGTAIMHNTIAVGKNDKNEIRAVVVPNEPVYIYTASGSATINSLKMTLSTDLAGTEWRLNDQATPLVGAWDITVVGTDGSAKPGRVWTDILFLNAKAHGRSIYPKMNVLTDDSYEYEVDFNGLQPYSFLFYSNNRGFLQNKVGVDGTRVITPLLHSFYSYGEDGGMGKLPTHLEKSGFTSTVIGNYTPYVEGVDHTNKLFLNEVSTDSMQAYNNQSSRSTDKGTTMDFIIPKYIGYGGNADNNPYELSSVAAGDVDQQMVGSSGSLVNGQDKIIDVNKGTEGLGGKFVFTITKAAQNDFKPAENTGSEVALGQDWLDYYNGKSFSLRLDFSGYKLDENNAPVLTQPKNYTDPVTKEIMQVQEWQSNGGDPSEKEKNNKVLLSTLIKGAGEYTLIWDGRDAYGNEVPVTVGNPAGGSVNSYPVQRFTESGIVHLPMVDVERLPWGIKVHRLTNPTTGSGVATSSEAEQRDDSWDLYYNNDSISPSFNNAGAIQSSLINDTFTNSDGESEINQGVYDFTPDSSWYYAGRSRFPYPSQIGDGVNRSAGISTADGGKMNVLAYDSKDKYDATTYDSKNIGTYRTSTVAKEKYNNISTNEQSYGDRAGLDMWASALSAPVMMHVGVNPNTFTTYSPAIVSFVAEEGRTKIAAPLDQSHVATSDGTRVNYPNHVGRPSTGDYNAAIGANEQGSLTTFGNTISTAFLSELTSGPTYHAVEGQSEAQRYDIDGILWTITIPQQDIEKNYVKLGDGSYAKGWADLKDTYVMEDKASFTISNKQVTFDNEHRINKGKIYSMKKDNNGDLQMKIKFRIPEFSVGTGQQRKVSVGLVLDNIYAPNASAIATYVDADNAKVDASTGIKTGETWPNQANFYKTQSAFTEMNSSVKYTDDAGTAYEYEAGKGYVKKDDINILPNVIPGIVVTMEDMGYVEGRTFDDETKDNNAFFNHTFNTYTGTGGFTGKVYTVNDEEAQLFSDEFVVDFWDVVESAESIGDIVGEQSEVNDGSSNEIDMEDLSNGIETIDDIMGAN